MCSPWKRTQSGVQTSCHTGHAENLPDAPILPQLEGPVCLRLTQLKSRSSGKAHLSYPSPGPASCPPARPPPHHTLLPEELPPGEGRRRRHVLVSGTTGTKLPSPRVPRDLSVGAAPASCPAPHPKVFGAVSAASVPVTSHRNADP